MFYNLRLGKVLKEYNSSFFVKFIAILIFEEQSGISQNTFYTMFFILRVVKMAKLDLNLAAKHTCQIPGLLLANTVRKIKI